MGPKIAGVSVTPLNVIARPGGAVLHMLRSDSPLFAKFGEIYFSELEPGHVRAWKRHKEMTQNFAVPVGRVKFALYDDRPASETCGALLEFELGRPDAYQLLTIPPLVWYGFACASEQVALIVNCADLAHRPEESEQVSVEAASFPAVWK